MATTTTTAARGLSREEVDALGPKDVHRVLGRVMLADGLDMVIDLDKSHGSYIVDELDGREYLDLFGYFASSSVGHNHPRVACPEFKEHMGRVAIHNPTNSDVYSVEFAQFVATFERVAMPPEFKHVFFVAGGALAVENAIKAASDWKVQKNHAAGKPDGECGVIHFTNAFHGRTGYTLSLTNTDPVKTKHFPKFNWPRIESPASKFPLEGDNLRATIEAEERALKSIRDVLQTRSDDMCAILIETISGEGGDMHWRREFLQSLRQLADQYNVWLIFDEVQCGMGSTGFMWAFQYYGVIPDAFSFGKKTQVCGFMCTSRIDEVKDNVFSVPSRINSTFGGNLADMVRVQRYLEIIEEEKLVENAAKVGSHLLSKLHELQRKYPSLVSNVRGLGLFCALDLPDGDTRGKFRSLLLQKGVMALGSGSRSVRFRPALNISASDIDKAIAAMDEGLKQMSVEI